MADDLDVDRGDRRAGRGGGGVARGVVDDDDLDRRTREPTDRAARSRCSSLKAGMTTPIVNPDTCTWFLPRPAQAGLKTAGRRQCHTTVLACRSTVKEQRHGWRRQQSHLVGNLGSDPEMRHTPSGAGVCEFRLATNESWTDKSGQRQERTEWHRVVVWGKHAEVCSQYLSKGRQVYVEGRLRTRSVGR